MKKIRNIFYFIITFSIQCINTYATSGIEDIEKGILKISIKSLQDLEKVSNLVFSGHTFFKVCTYLGREEVGNIQRVRKEFYDYINNNNRLWKYYYDALKIDNINIYKDYKTLVKDYFKLTFLIMNDTQSYNNFRPENICAGDTLIVGSTKMAHGQLIASKIVITDGSKEISGFLNNDNRWSRILNTNSDGSISIGLATDGNNKHCVTAFKCSQGKPLESLGLLNNGSSSRAIYTNSDGSEIFGIANDGKNHNTPTLVKWLNGKIEVIATLKDEKRSLHPMNINSDASIAVGYASQDGTKMDERAFRWVKGDISYLESLVDERPSQALWTNFDGSIVVGWANNGKRNNQTAVLWDKFGHVQSLEAYVMKLNSQMNFPDLRTVNGISPDGSNMVGLTQDNKVFILHRPRLELFMMNP